MIVKNEAEILEKNCWARAKVESLYRYTLRSEKRRQPKV